MDDTRYFFKSDEGNEYITIEKHSDDRVFFTIMDADKHGRHVEMTCDIPLKSLDMAVTQFKNVPIT